MGLILSTTLLLMTNPVNPLVRNYISCSEIVLKLTYNHEEFQIFRGRTHKPQFPAEGSNGVVKLRYCSWVLQISLQYYVKKIRQSCMIQGNPFSSSYNEQKPFSFRALPGPAGGAHSTPPDPLAEFRESLIKSLLSSKRSYR